MKSALQILGAALAVHASLAFAAEFTCTNTFGPNDTVQATGARQISDTPTFAGVAVRFQAGVGGPLEQIHVPLTRSGATPTTTPRTFTVRTDVSNLPGTVIDSFVLTPTTTYTIYRPRSVTKPVLTAGAFYWLVGEFNPTGTARDLWNLNNQSIFGRIAQQTSVNGAWTPTDTQQLMAFRITVSDIKYGSISGAVEADTNGDNQADTVLAGVTLTLKDSEGKDVDGDPNTTGTQPTQKVTSQNGTYTFVNVPPGTYQVVESNPSGYGSISDSDGGNPDVIASIVVPDNGAAVGNNFLDQQLAVVTGTVLSDTDGDGDGEAPLAGVTVGIYEDANLDGEPDSPVGGGTPVPVASTTTDTQGFYTLADLPPRPFVIVESDPTFYRSVADADTTGDATFSPADLPNTKVADSLIPVNLAGGETDTGNDFVDQKCGWIRGVVSVDTDYDGAGDTRLPDVAVTLKTQAGGDVDSDPETRGTQPTTTTTDRVGHYLFDFVPPGSYLVVETQPLGFVSLGDADGGNFDIVGDQQPVVVTAGVESADNDFFEAFYLLRVISGAVLAHTDADTVPDARVRSVKLTLKRMVGGNEEDIDSNPGTPEIEPTIAYTDPIGIYVFQGLGPGTYRVRESQPLGFVSVTDKDGGTDDIIDVDLTQMLSSLDNDFEERAKEPPTAASLEFFRAIRSDPAGVLLEWQVLVEVQVVGYHLEQQTATGEWQRVTRQLIPARGHGAPRTLYRFEDASEVALGTKYRLIEVNMLSEERSVAETAVRLPLFIRLASTSDGLAVEVSGGAEARVTIETTAELGQPWTTAGDVVLDGSGRGTLTVPADAASLTRFIRAVQP